MGRDLRQREANSTRLGTNERAEEEEEEEEEETLI